MADVDFDFFDDPAPGIKGKNDHELSPRTSKHGGKKKIETKLPSMRREYSSGESENDSARNQRHRHSSKKSVEVVVDSDDSESESDSNREQLNSSGVKKHAWSEDTKSDGVRPKSAHPSGRSARHRNRPADSKRRSHSNSPTKSESRSRSRSGSRSGTDSSDYSTSSEYDDSDITDVSPLSSPLSTARSSASGRKSRQGPPKYGSMKPPKSPSIKSDASSRSRPTSAKLNKLLRADQDSMDLRLLMQAVLEMEQEREREELSSNTSKQPRFVVPQSSSQRKNMSFRNDKTREIDRENTRLMQQIVRYAAEAKKKKMMQRAAPRKRQQPVVGRVLTTSAVNRKREQERIDRENQVWSFCSTSCAGFLANSLHVTEKS